ncbi:hypothetical protein [Actinacidiphila sp. bgisy144]|uniref:hypothetical protein n=1 Tax=Actinacidiphila sp. bgisy144 TaxID=3413791 RepID=UPI003EB9F87E
MSKERDDGATESTAPGPGDAEHTADAQHPAEAEHRAEHLVEAAHPVGAGDMAAADHPDRGERPARKPRWAVAAVVAAVLVAGGGGAWWATAAGGGGSTASTPLRIDGPVGVASSTSDGGSGPYHLTGTLPKGPQKAAVYAPSGSVARADATRLAGLLGLSGGVRSENGSWRAGAAAGADAPSLVVSKAAPGTWSYSAGGTPTTGTRGGGSDASPVPAAKAKAVAAPVLKGLGLSGAKVDASTAVGAIRTVTADPVVGGAPTHGWTTSLQIGADGRIGNGFGRLSDLAKGDTYPVVSAATALKELNSSTTIMHPGAVNGGAVTRSGTAGASGSAGTTGTLPGGGTEQRTEVRGATFGLALQYVAGVQTLVPAWLFTTAPEGATHTSVVAQTAVDPRYITSGVPSSTPPSGATSPTPSVNPGGPILPTPTGPTGSTGRTVHRVPVQSYTVSGRTLTLVYEGGGCDTYKASASESGDQVRVSVVATPKSGVCPMFVTSLHQTVTLTAPLGSRTVVDASNGQSLSGR